MNSNTVDNVMLSLYVSALLICQVLGLIGCFSKKSNLVLGGCTVTIPLTAICVVWLFFSNIVEWQAFIVPIFIILAEIITVCMQLWNKRHMQTHNVGWGAAQSVLLTTSLVYFILILKGLFTIGDPLPVGPGVQVFYRGADVPI